MRVLGASPRDRLADGVCLGQRIGRSLCWVVLSSSCGSPRQPDADRATSQEVAPSVGHPVASEAPVSTVSHEDTDAAALSSSVEQGQSGAESGSAEQRYDERTAGTTQSGSGSAPDGTGSEPTGAQTRDRCELTLYSLPGQYGLSAQFTRVTSDAPLTQLTAGDCTTSEYAMPFEVTREYLDAGTIYLTGEGIDYPESYSLEISRYESGAYEGDTLLTGYIPGRAELHIWSSGGRDVDAFESDLSFPLSLILTAPIAGASGALEMSASSGVVLHWERGIEDVFLLVEAQRLTETRRHHIRCWFPSLDGTGSIPAPLLAPFVGGQLDMYTVVKKQLEVGTYDVIVQGLRGLYNPDKSLTVWGEVVP